MHADCFRKGGLILRLFHHCTLGLRKNNLPIRRLGFRLSFTDSILLQGASMCFRLDALYGRKADMPDAVLSAPSTDLVKTH